MIYFECLTNMYSEVVYETLREQVIFGPRGSTLIFGIFNYFGTGQNRNLCFFPQTVQFLKGRNWVLCLQARFWLCRGI